MRAEQETRPWALVWVGAGASLWGTDTFFRRPLAMSLSSAQIVLCEHLILSVVLLPVFWQARSQWRALRLSQWGAVLGIAWGGSALGTICFTEAIKLGNPTAAVFLQKTQPLFAAFLAALLLGERLQGRFWICLLFTVAGAYLVSFGESPAFFANPAVLAPGRTAAALLALGAAALWGSSTVFGRFALQSVPFLTLTALRILCATPLLAAFAWLGRRQIEVHLQTRQWLYLALMALVPGLLGLLVYYRGLRYTRASLAALAELSFPATAALLNWIFLRTRITAIQAGGFLLVWLVIVYLDRSARRDKGNSAAVAAA
ncbi:MAG TPA: DMT family transporter [Bryobacterales bacterium]|jgi:drug/metabolite transporter (DMT)-like permease|nr:DMT family transporter [Bryobacterales bacterium]